MPSAIENLRSQVMSTRAVMINSLNLISTERDRTISSMRGAMSQGQEGGILGGGGIPSISSIRSRFLAPTAQQAGGAAEQKGILSGILGGKGVLGILSGENGNGGAPQEGGILGRIKKLRTNILNDTPTGQQDAPRNTFLNAPPERTAAQDTMTPMGAIPTDASVTNLRQKGGAITTLGLVEVD